MLLKVERCSARCEATLGARIDALETRATDLETRRRRRRAPRSAEATLDLVRNRFRRLDLSTTTTTFRDRPARHHHRAGHCARRQRPRPERSQHAPLGRLRHRLGHAQGGTGFTSRGGAGDQTLSVRVNSEGVAQVLIRSAHAEAFTEEEELEVEGFLATRPQAGNCRRSPR